MALQYKVISANGSKGHHKFALTVTENSTSVANNTSSVSWLLQIDAIQGGWDWHHTNLMSYSVTINGKTYSGVLNDYDGWSTVVIRQDTIPVAHGSDGKKTINYSFSISSLNYYYAPGSASTSGSMTLTNIPRQATISSAPHFNDEANPQITYSNPAGTAVDSLQACISLTGAAADIPYRDISKTGTSYTFELTTAERNTLRNATTGNSRNVIFYVKTVIAGVTYYSTLTRTLSIINANPTLTVDAVDTNEKTLGFTGDPHRWIRHYSNVQVSATATAQKGASIKSTTGTGLNNNVIKDSFTVTTTDSRGNSTSKTVKGTLIPYVYVTTNFKPRVDINGKVTIDVSGNFYNGNFGTVNNVLSIQYRYKKGNGSYGNWASYTGATKSNNTYSGTIEFNIPNFDYKSQYTVQLHVSDKLLTLNPDPYTISAKPLFDWGEEDFNFNTPINMNENTVLRYNDNVNNVVLSAGGGAIYLRPGGTSETGGEMRLSSNGNLELKGELIINGVNITAALRSAGII